MKTSTLPSLIVYLLLPISALIFLASVSQQMGLVMNVSPSMPLGVYRQADSVVIKRGSLVSVCLTPSLAHQAVAQGYVAQNADCPDHAQRLIKEVIGIPGDTVLLRSGTVTINPGTDTAKQYPAPVHRYSLTHHRVISTIKPGQFYLQGYWLYGEGSPNLSWDSRYFGEVKREQIRSVLTPLWIDNTRGRA